MKKRNKINILPAFSIAFLCFTLISPGSTFSQSKWEVPSEYATLKNDYSNSKDFDGVGKSLYNTHCKSCHGSKGDGKGKMLSGIETDIINFADQTFQNQSDGEIYYKIINGKGVMPGFDKKITESEDRWLLVNFLRKFKK